MKDHRKILVLFGMIMLIYSAIVIINMVVNFRLFSKEAEINKANVIANLVKDGLTAHMVSGTMDKRSLFLNNVKTSTNALKIWIFRTKKVEELFGKGLNDEYVRDTIDKDVVEKAKTLTKIEEDTLEPKLRITIPYVATSHSNPDCLKCHTNAKEGDVLGGITMIFDITKTRDASILTILKIAGVSLVFIFLLLALANYYLKPYTRFIDDIRDAFKKIYKGDYTQRIKTEKYTNLNETIGWMNSFMDKLESTIKAIEDNISLFVIDRQKKYSDPLEKSKDTIEDIAKIYKFKKTIELDISKDIIYQRLVKIFKDEFGLEDLSLYEVDVKNDTRTLIHDDTPEKFCDIADTKTSKRCRAYRTNSIVSSDDFDEVCRFCKTTKEYLCINFTINEGTSLILNIKPETTEELRANKRMIGYVRNYLEAARPVLQSRILNDILQKSNLIDGLTELYNRKYLDEFMDDDIKSYEEYAFAMIDIDYFKKVNDTYGHDAGDKVLKGLSDILKKSVKKDDIVFRFGGEEFAIFLPHIDEALDTVKNIKDNFENAKFNVGNENISKTLSVGLAFHKKSNGLTSWQVIKQADVALYKAKEGGRNRIEIFSKDDEE